MHPTFTLMVLSSNITKFPSAVPTNRKLLCLLKGKMSNGYKIPLFWVTWLLSSLLLTKLETGTLLATLQPHHLETLTVWSLQYTVHLCSFWSWNSLPCLVSVSQYGKAFTKDLETILLTCNQQQRCVSIYPFTSLWEKVRTYLQQGTLTKTDGWFKIRTPYHHPQYPAIFSTTVTHPCVQSSPTFVSVELLSPTMIAS